MQTKFNDHDRHILLPYRTMNLKFFQRYYVS